MTDAVPTVAASGRPKLSRHVRMTFDRTRGQHVLLEPETVVVLNPTGADILGLCDGDHTVAEIVEELVGRYDSADGVVASEVAGFLTRLVAKRCVEITDGLCEDR